MIYLLTAIGLSPGGSSTVHIYTQTIYRTIHNKQYIEQHNNWMSAGLAPSWHDYPSHPDFSYLSVNITFLSTMVAQCLSFPHLNSDVTVLMSAQYRLYLLLVTFRFSENILYHSVLRYVKIIFMSPSNIP